MYTEIRCLECLEIIDAERLDLDKKWADCQACGNSFGFEHKWDSKLRKKRETFQPDGFDVVKTASLLEITIDPKANLPDIQLLKSAKAVAAIVGKIFGTLVIIFLCIFVVGFAKQELRGALQMQGYLNLFFGVGIACFMIGLIFWVFILGRHPKHKLSLTKTQFKWKPTNIDNTNNPPRKNVKFDMESKEIKQLYVRTTEKNMMIYELVIIKNNGEEVTPIGPQFNLHHALFLEQEIEQFLDIRDETQTREFKT